MINKNTFSHALLANQLFLDLNVDLLEGRKIKKKYKNKNINKIELASKIFEDSFSLILFDIINNNTIFVLPSIKNKYAEIYIESLSGDEFKRKRSNGAFASIDYMKSEFTANSLIFYWKSKRKYKKKQIYLFNNIKKLLNKHTYKLKKYS